MRAHAINSKTQLDLWNPVVVRRKCPTQCMLQIYLCLSREKNGLIDCKLAVIMFWRRGFLYESKGEKLLLVNPDKCCRQ